MLCNSSKRNYIYWICGPMIIMAVVISNAYKGENITELTSPIAPTPYDTFDQLIEESFDINSPAVVQATANLGLGALMFFASGWDDDKKYVTAFANTVIFIQSFKGTQNKSDLLHEHIKLHDLAVAIVQNNFSLTYVDILKDCKKTAIADFNSELLELAINLKKHFVSDENEQKRHSIHIATETLLTKKRGLEIYRSIDPRIPIRHGALITSGIILKWSNFVRRKLDLVNIHQLSDIVNQFKALKLYGNVLAQFLILGVGLALSLIVFWMELFCAGFKAMVMYSKSLYGRFVLGICLILFRIGYWIRYRKGRWF